jgi:hypothetical protein
MGKKWAVVFREILYRRMLGMEEPATHRGIIIILAEY